jgi:hypothetical protein
MDRAMLQVLANQKMDMSDDNMNFASSSWLEVEEAVRAVAGRQASLITKDKAKNRLQSLRRTIFHQWTTHRSHISGWEVNSDGLPIAADEDEANQHYIENYPQCAPFRYSMPLNMDLMEVIFTRAAASGVYATNGSADIVSSIEDSSSSSQVSHQMRLNMARRLPHTASETVTKRRKKEAAKEAAAIEDALFERQAAAISDGATGRATARLFKDVPAIKLAVNKESKKIILKYLESKAIAQTFLNLPKDELVSYCDYRMDAELLLAEPDDLEQSPGV